MQKVPQKSWLLLPSGELVLLSETQGLLIDCAASQEDSLAILDDLRQLLAESRRIMTQARCQLKSSRRQRLGLHLISKTSSLS